jgi:hypothetical protein
VTSMFRWVLIRPCTPPEHGRLETLLQSLISEFTADPAAARAMLNSARLSLPDAEHEQVVLAARTVVASVILNLDETLMRP